MQIKSTGADRNLNIQRLNVSAENKSKLQKFMNREFLSNHLGPFHFPEKIPTYTASGGDTVDTVNISPQSAAMLSAQVAQSQQTNIIPGTANARRAAAGLPLREIPEDQLQYVFRHTDFRIFAESVLSPHMDNADEHIARMEWAILDPSRNLNTNLTLAERTILRETILQEAKRIAKNYLDGEDAQRFIDGFANLIQEAEMVERGYIRVEDRSDPNNVTFRRPFDEPDNVARHDFLMANMTAEQKAHLDSLIAIRHSKFEIVDQMSRDENGNIRSNFREYMQEYHPEVWAAYAETVFAVRGFFDEMAEYHGFMEQWEAWLAGDAPDDNWFVQREVAFEENSPMVAEEIVVIQHNFQSQLSLDGMDGFRSIFEQLWAANNANGANPFWQWLLSLRVFGE